MPLTNIEIKQWPLCLFVLLSGLVAFSANISAPVTDNFHEGEFIGFVWHMRDYYSDLANFPVLVHGGMDYVPALVALSVFGQDSLIVGTRIILLIITAFQYFFLLDTGYLLIKNNRAKTFWVFLLILYFFVSTPPLNSEVMDVSYFPVRDIFLSLTVWGVIKSIYSKNSVLRRIFLAVAAVSSAIGFYWCYNKGIIACVFLAVFVIWLFSKKYYNDFLLLLVCWLACLGVNEKYKLFGTTLENLRNISYWITSASEVNYIRFKFQYIQGLASVIALLLFSLFVFIVFCFMTRRIDYDDRLEKFVVAGFFAIQIFNIKIVLGVPIQEYSLNAGWPSVMLLLFMFSRLTEIEFCLPMIRKNYRIGDNYLELNRKILITSLAVFLIFIGFCNKNMFMTELRFAKNLISTIKNEKVLSSDIIALSKYIKNADEKCYFNWANDGVVAFLSEKIYCTDYPYAHYIAKSHEPLSLSQLKEASPSLVVVDSDFWPFTRYKENMSERLPIIAAYLHDEYKNTIDVGRYKVALRGDVPP